MSDYMESKVRWLHHKLDVWIDAGEQADISDVPVEL